MSNSDKIDCKIKILAFVFFVLVVVKIITVNMSPYIAYAISLGFIALLYVLLIYKYQNNVKEGSLNTIEMEPGDSGIFKFTLTLLATLGTILYTTYNYFQMNAIKESHYIIIYILISGVLIYIILSLMYVVLKALSMGPLGNIKKNYINLISARLYLFNIVISLFLILLFVYFISVAYLRIGLYGSNLLIFLIGSIFLIALLLYFMSIISSIGILDKILIGVSIYIVIFIIWVPIYSAISASPLLLGHITVDINDIYSNSDTRIPFPIQITGPDTNIYIKLNNETQNENLKKTWDITLSPDPPNYNESDDKSLTGYALGNGAYIVYIDTTSLPTGYYKLNCTRPEYAQSYTAKGFYISDSRETNTYNY